MSVLYDNRNKWLCVLNVWVWTCGEGKGSYFAFLTGLVTSVLITDCPLIIWLFSVVIWLTGNSAVADKSHDVFRDINVQKIP